jgi:hypothetical protein
MSTALRFWYLLYSLDSDGVTHHIIHKFSDYSTLCGKPRHEYKRSGWAILEPFYPKPNYVCQTCYSACIKEFDTIIPEKPLE